MKYKFRTKQACRIADIHRDRFNEAVAAGNYPCAPKVLRGSTRVFDEDDLIVLFFYGRMLEEGYQPKLAGRLVCLVRDELRCSKDSEDEILLVRTAASNYEVWRGSHVKEIIRRGNAGHSWVFWRLSFDIGNIREYVQREAEVEASILGADDEGEK